MRKRVSLGVACLVPVALMSFASLAEDAPRVGSPMALSRIADYARQVAEECVRHKAYGLSTNGLSLSNFCQHMANTEAMKLHSKLMKAGR